MGCYINYHLHLSIFTLLLHFYPDKKKEQKMGFSPLLLSFVFVFWCFFLLFCDLVLCLEVSLLSLLRLGRRRSLLDGLLLGRRRRLCRLSGLLGRLGRGLLNRLLGLGDLLGRYEGECMLEDGVIRERLVLSIAEGLAGGAEGEARGPDRCLGIGVLLLLHERGDARAEGEPGREDLLLALCRRSLCLLHLLCRGHALQLSQSLLNEGEASSQGSERGRCHSLGGHG